MRVKVLFFAAAREAAGTSETALDVPEGCTVGALLERLGRDAPDVASVLAGCRAAVDEEFAPRSRPLGEGQVVAVLPPVSGG